MQTKNEYAASPISKQLSNLCWYNPKVRHIWNAANKVILSTCSTPVNHSQFTCCVLNHPCKLGFYL